MTKQMTIHEHRDGIRAAEYQVGCCEDHYSDDPDAPRLLEKWTKILNERRLAFRLAFYGDIDRAVAAKIAQDDADGDRISREHDEQAEDRYADEGVED